MGSLKFPHASGNSMSIAAPATNPASDLELKLPATIGTAGQVLKNSSTAGILEFGAAGGGGKILQVVRNYNAGPVTSTNTDWTDLFSSDLSITVSSNSNPIILFATWASRLDHSSGTTGDFESSHLLKVTTSGETNNNVGTRPAARAKNVQELRDTLTGMWFYTGYTATTQTFMWQHEKGSHATSLESKWIHSVILEVEA